MPKLRLHYIQVLDATNPALRSQYAAVSFALSDAYSPNPATGLIPQASIRVSAAPLPRNTAAAWSTPCTGPMPTAYATRLSQSCGPAVSMCGPTAAAANSLATAQFATVNIPLLTGDGGALLDVRNPAALASGLGVELVISVRIHTCTICKKMSI